MRDKLGDTSSLILQILANNKKMAQFDIPEKVGKHYSTVFRQLKKLKKKKLVKIVAKYTSKKHGKDKEIFSLTLSGWITCFAQNIISTENVPIFIDEFTESFPIVFGQWGHFKKEGVEEIAKKHLIRTLKIFSLILGQVIESIKNFNNEKNQSELELTWMNNFKKKWVNQKSWKEEITNIFLYYAFKTNYWHENRLSYVEDLPYDQKNKLEEAIENNERLNAYRLMLLREETKNYTINKPVRYDCKKNLLWDPTTVENTIFNIVQVKKWEKHGIVDPLYSIADLVTQGDLFSATVETVKLYKNYTFSTVKECLIAIFGLIKNLARKSDELLDKALAIENFEKNDLHVETKIELVKSFEIMSQKLGKKTEAKDILNHWGFQIFEIWSGIQFFTLEEMQVGDRLFYKIILSQEKVEEYEEKKKQKIDYWPMVAEQTISSIKQLQKESTKVKDLDQLEPNKLLQFLAIQYLIESHLFNSFV